jgi:hypothetical protein
MWSKVHTKLLLGVQVTPLVMQVTRSPGYKQNREKALELEHALEV